MKFILALYVGFVVVSCGPDASECPSIDQELECESRSDALRAASSEALIAEAECQSARADAAGRAGDWQQASLLWSRVLRLEEEAAQAAKEEAAGSLEAIEGQAELLSDRGSASSLLVARSLEDQAAAVRVAAGLPLDPDVAARLEADAALEAKFRADATAANILSAELFGSHAEALIAEALLLIAEAESVTGEAQALLLAEAELLIDEAEASMAEAAAFVQ